MNDSLAREMTKVWVVFVLILGAVGVAYNIQAQIGLVSSGAGAAPLVAATVLPTSYWYVNVFFYVVFAPLIVSYAWRTSSLLDAEATVARLALLAFAIWVVRVAYNLGPPYNQAPPSSTFVFYAVLNLGVFGALNLLGLRARRAMVWAAVAIGFLWGLDMVVPGLPVIRYPSPAEFASGLVSYAMFVFAVRALWSGRRHAPGTQAIEAPG